MARGEGPPAVPARPAPVNAHEAPEAPGNRHRPGAALARWLVHSPPARIVIFVAILGAMIFLLRILFVTVGWAGKAAPVAERYVGMLVTQLVPALGCLPAPGPRHRTKARGRTGLAHGRPARRARLPGGRIADQCGGRAAVVVRQLRGHRLQRRPELGPPVADRRVGGGGGRGIITRGVLFRIAEEGLGTWGALVLSAIVFGFGHIFNPGATVWSSWPSRWRPACCSACCFT